MEEESKITKEKLEKVEEDPKIIEGKEGPSLAGSIAYNVVTSSLFRKSVFLGAMYAGGSTIIATVGATPVLVVGTLIWLL